MWHIWSKTSIQHTSFKLGGNSPKCGMEARNWQYWGYSFSLTETQAQFIQTPKKLMQLLTSCTGNFQSLFNRAEHKHICAKHGLIIQTKCQTLFWTCQVPSIRTCTCLYLAPSSELQAHTAVLYQVPCTCMHTDTFVSSFVLSAHNGTKHHATVQNWYNCQMNKLATYRPVSYTHLTLPTILRV